LLVRGQWHRHRTWSYNEISRRYTTVDLEFYVPNTFRKQSESNRQASTDEIIENNAEAFTVYKGVVDKSFEAYEKLLELGVCKEQARGVLPQNLMTTFWATANLRNILHFIELRDDEHAQKEIREYAQAMKELIKPYVPHAIEYLEGNKYEN
jgi:thymidylate synthase (FAD)